MKIPGAALLPLATVSYDRESRLNVVNEPSGHIVETTTYTYSGDGLKRAEVTATVRTTLVWDGSDYLGEY